jgi:voltage-gated potassium channel
MYCLALSFLIVVAILLVLWVDVPIFLAAPDTDAGAAKEQARVATCWISHETAMRAGYICLDILTVFWICFVGELLFQFAIRDRARPFWRQRYYSLIVCLCPPLRLSARNFDMDGKVWFPTIGWQEADDSLREGLEKAFSVPMIFIAMTILPVLLVEFGMHHLVWTRPWLQLLLHASTGLIWFAFAVEFVVMVSVAEKKLRYCKEHWLDLAIILLPFISFLRTLRVVRATRVARLAKIQQLSRMGRLYRLRGLAMRAVRALMILELLNRLFRIGPERQLKKLRMLLEEKEKEVMVLRNQIKKLEELIEQQSREGHESAEDPMQSEQGVEFNS